MPTPFDAATPAAAPAATPVLNPGFFAAFVCLNVLALGADFLPSETVLLEVTTNLGLVFFFG